MMVGRMTTLTAACSASLNFGVEINGTEKPADRRGGKTTQGINILSDVPEQLPVSSPNWHHPILSNVFCAAFRLARVKR